MKLGRLVREKTVLVCCGAGGVGKTTTSSALAMAAARSGRRALVLTIDPARRLAQALGIPPTGKEPVMISRELLTSRGVVLPEQGTLSAWMLDPRVVLETVVDRFAPGPEDARRIRETRLYQALGEVVAGLQEYTAAQALYDFYERDLYDLIVLDTPPSRNALDFLDAPRRLARFLDERTLAMFIAQPGKRASTMARAAQKVVATALSKTFGDGFAEELGVFLGAFGKLFGKMRVHASGVRKLLMSDESAFVVITSPDQVARSEAIFFKGRIKDLGLRSEGFILNRSYAQGIEPIAPASVRATMVGPPALLRGLDRLEPYADIERQKRIDHLAVLNELRREGQRDGGQGAVALPYLDGAVEDIPALDALATAILEAS